MILVSTLTFSRSGLFQPRIARRQKAQAGWRRQPAGLGIRRSARALGLPGTPAALAGHAAAWRPWRAYAAQYLRAVGGRAVN
jgi:hypothetical protein